MGVPMMRRMCGMGAVAVFAAASLLAPAPASAHVGPCMPSWPFTTTTTTATGGIRFTPRACYEHAVEEAYVDPILIETDHIAVWWRLVREVDGWLVSEPRQEVIVEANCPARDDVCLVSATVNHPEIDWHVYEYDFVYTFVHAGGTGFGGGFEECKSAVVDAWCGKTENHIVSKVPGAP